MKKKDDISRGIEYLRENTGKVKHGSGTFYDHLMATYLNLMEYGEKGYVCRAGLFHSIYGTCYFKSYRDGSLTREQVRLWIGNEAENLAHEFCSIEKRLPSLINRTGDWDDTTYRDLLIIEISNLETQTDEYLNEKIKKGLFKTIGKLKNSVTLLKRC